ncbi:MULTISPECIES: alanine--tRNA ligase [Nesterenkonia]|uniref:Alanine--tRNA ligase n=1 Tax=Nesterenkonia xinjiangensis TaxID=225327 RepID=A0A7Z0GQ15_9MICC|nr:MULTISPECIES: alanine--tRNA ligase [Nesterenkonia]MDZ5078430.1 alanine--tRNA ligase [Nesterenkonia sp. HG001]NYJ79584.1 alanyl-tRNA synthetase [Nesterenkonia xinjiangensis]
MKTEDITRTWYDYFAAKGHERVPSASLISPDPSVLFTIAGMVPFIPYFLGTEKAPYDRAVSVQKCIRTADIEEVGKTARHGTFFQMCGNFSFGDYFKEKAIPMAWELLTSPVDGDPETGIRGFGLDPERLWITVYEDGEERDEEARRIWEDVVGVPHERVVGTGKADNYWNTGQPGPGGPCSEIYYDRGPAYGVDGGPAVDEDRFMELWNLVFMQDRLSQVHSKTEFEIAGPLQNTNIDTGLGLERLAMVLQGAENMYETDQVRPVLDRAAELTGVTYASTEDPEDPRHADDVRLRMIADHVRSSLMLISDGVRPSNEGGGFVLRRLIRRVILAMRLMGVEEPVFGDLFSVSRDAMKGVYPEVAEDFDLLHQVAIKEEQAFLRTISAGTAKLESAVSAAKSSERPLSGADAFALHDTYGFPIDLTLEMAAEAGVVVDEGRFRELMTEQRERARADAKGKKSGHADTEVYARLRGEQPTHFTGYTEHTTESSIRGLVVDGRSTDRASAGEEVEIVLDATPFYAEAGGQAADTGRITGDGFELEVTDVQSPIRGLAVHRARVLHGEVPAGAQALGAIDRRRRLDAQKAHSATHIIHAALHDVVGPQAVQAGSFNKEGYLRFDFTAEDALSASARQELEEVANLAIRDNHAVSTQVMSLDDAQAMGAMMLFGEKYGDEVRVVEMNGAWSRELCGGTHVGSTAEIGTLALMSEASVGSGNRRVEALVGLDAFSHFAAERTLVNRLTDMLKVPAEQVPDRISSTLQKLRDTERELERLRAERLRAQAGELVKEAVDADGVDVLAHAAGPVSGGDDLRALALDLRQRFGSRAAVVAVAGEAKGRPLIVVATTEAAREAGVQAGALVKEACAVLGGGGGGKPDVAQGGGQDVSRIGDALQGIVRSVRARG